jgi:hypothetical protein
VVTVERSHDPELFKRVDDVITRSTRLFWWRFRLNDLRHRWAGRRAQFTYLFRNYFVDGALPVLVAITAPLALSSRMATTLFARPQSPTARLAGRLMSLLVTEWRRQ